MEFYEFEKVEDFIAFLVSIPNGMEFYASILSNRRNYDSFNSQRDGILRILEFCAF